MAESSDVLISVPNRNQNKTKLFQHESNNTSGKAILTIDADTHSIHPVNPWLYGKFCEHLGTNIYHGMEAQILFNCTFGKWRFSVDNHPDGGAYGWFRVGAKEEEFLASGIILLKLVKSHPKYVRTLFVRKMRGTATDLSEYAFDILTNRSIVIRQPL